jgi:uncharacterized membrane protein
MVEIKRHIAKTISYRIVSTMIGFIIMWYVTGSIAFASALGAGELILKPIIYFLHERIWYRWIKYGLKK